MLTFEQIKELIDLVSEKDLQGVEVERSGFRLKIEGKNVAQVIHLPAASASPVAGGAAPAAQAVTAPVPTPVAVAPAPEADAEAADEIAGAHLLRSPIVGTFYTAPSPDADVYVRVGDRVRRGQVLCIIEAMKLMNEIESDEDGVVAQIFQKNAQPVEYGEALFAIQPD